MNSGNTIITLVSAVVAGCVGVVGGYMLCKKTVVEKYEFEYSNNDDNRSGQNFKSIFGGTKFYRKKHSKSKRRKRR